MSGMNFKGRSGSITGKLAQMPALPKAAERLTREVLKDEPDLGEVVRASISAAHGQLFIRTTRRLYCVGQGR